jgi:integrase
MSLLTACRRSEIVNLEWSQIKENYIQLIHTKSGRPRKVYLTLQAKELLKTIEKKQERLFTYTLAGFDGSFVKFMKNNNLSHIHFHDFRRESISRFIEQIGSDNSILITEILGFANVKRFEENHITNSSVSISTEEDLLKSIGHSNKQTTKIYTNLK